MKTTNKGLVLKLDDLYIIDPMTPTQQHVFNDWNKYPIHVLHGVAGTGKSFISVYKALNDVLNLHNKYKRLVLLRSAVSARDIGHLPGDENEKAAVYELPYEEICNILFGKRDAYQRLKEQHKIQFGLTSFLRGITFDDSIVVVDEIQNMSYVELYTTMTRIGENSKVVFCGDYRQTDLKGSGLQKFLNVLNCMKSVCHYEFNIDDIVRSKIVKEFIIAEGSVKDSIHLPGYAGGHNSALVGISTK